MRTSTFCLIGLVSVFLMGPSFAAGSVPPPDKTQEYIACGCGCCSGVPTQDECLYKNKGDSLAKIIEVDKEKASDSKFCATAGCSLPVRYHYCD